eukprot:7274554-Prymnesium_polylepis.2
MAASAAAAQSLYMAPSAALLRQRVALLRRAAAVEAVATRARESSSYAPRAPSHPAECRESRGTARGREWPPARRACRPGVDLRSASGSHSSSGGRRRSVAQPCGRSAVRRSPPPAARSRGAGPSRLLQARGARARPDPRSPARTPARRTA